MLSRAFSKPGKLLQHSIEVGRDMRLVRDVRITKRCFILRQPLSQGRVGQRTQRRRVRTQHTRSSSLENCIKMQPAL